MASRHSSNLVKRANNKEQGYFLQNTKLLKVKVLIRNLNLKIYIKGITWASWKQVVSFMRDGLVVRDILNTCDSFFLGVIVKNGA